MKDNIAVVFDACVLFQASLRDLIIEISRPAFHKQYFRAKWTEKIHEEWISSLLYKRPDLSRQALERTRRLIATNVPTCLVTGYEHRISSLKLKDEKDRHILAAAIECEASIIVTFNLKDFPAGDLKAFGIIAKHPDDFICEFLNDNGKAGEELLETAVRAIKERLKNPKVTWAEYFSRLETNRLRFTVEKLKQLIYIAGALDDKS
jgi:predicted nucleic acid-binding protein